MFQVVKYYDAFLYLDFLNCSFLYYIDLIALKSSQRCDLKESLKLALNPNVNFDSFRKPLKTKNMLLRIDDETHHFELQELMTHLLRCCVNLPLSSECARYLTEQV